MLSTHSLTANIQALNAHAHTAASDIFDIKSKAWCRKTNLRKKEKFNCFEDHVDLILGEFKILSLHHMQEIKHTFTVKTVQNMTL